MRTGRIPKSKTHRTQKGDPTFDDMAVDLGPPPARPNLDLPRDERRALEQIDYEDQVVRFLLHRYKLNQTVRELTPEGMAGTKYSLQNFCHVYQEFPFFLTSYRLEQTTRRAMSFFRFFYDPIPSGMVAALQDQNSVRDAFGDHRPAGLLVMCPGLSFYRCPYTRRLVQVARCGGFVVTLGAIDGLTMSETEIQPPVMTLALEPGLPRIRLQSFAALVYQLDLSNTFNPGSEE